MKQFAVPQLFVFALLSGIIASGCEKDCANPDGIVGQWRWVESYSPGSGFTLTPEMEGYTISLEFDDYYYYRYRNDSLTNKRQYDLVISDTLMHGQTQFLELDSFLAYSMELTPDELRLEEYTLIHGYIHTYHRVK